MTFKVIVTMVKKVQAASAEDAWEACGELPKEADGWTYSGYPEVVEEV